MMLFLSLALRGKLAYIVSKFLRKDIFDVQSCYTRLQAQCL